MISNQPEQEDADHGQDGGERPRGSAMESHLAKIGRYRPIIMEPAGPGI